MYMANRPKFRNRFSGQHAVQSPEFHKSLQARVRYVADDRSKFRRPNNGPVPRQRPHPTRTRIGTLEASLDQVQAILKRPGFGGGGHDNDNNPQALSAERAAVPLFKD